MQLSRLDSRTFKLKFDFSMSNSPSLEITNTVLEQLVRIADALEARYPSQKTPIDWSAADAFVWSQTDATIKPVPRVSYMPLDLLCGIDQSADVLLQNTRHFAKGYGANNALLWGARGMGKSTLVKAIHAEILSEIPNALALVEIYREDIADLSILLDAMRHANRRFLLFCDDLSFDSQDNGYKSLKALLDGGLEGRPENVLFYATSNRRHLLNRDMIENEQSTAIHPGEAVEEKVSLSDRFGLWLGFHSCTQQDYFEMVRRYATAFDLDIAPDRLEAEAREWQVTRGSRSGRVAWQYIQDLAGRLGKPIIFRPEA